MKDKRISLRFRAENERDMQAWKLLEEMTQKANLSKNSIVIELILSSSKQQNDDEGIAEHIAELVAHKLENRLIVSTTSDGIKEAIVSKDERGFHHDEPEPVSDEPEFLGEDVLDFLDLFG